MTSRAPSPCSRSWRRSRIRTPGCEAESCSALGKLRDPAAVESLLQATRDPEHKVRVLAMAALDGMGTVAIAVSIAALLRPMLGEAVAKESPQDVATAPKSKSSPARATRWDAGPGPSPPTSSRPSSNGRLRRAPRKV